MKRLSGILSITALIFSIFVFVYTVVVDPITVEVKETTENNNYEACQPGSFFPDDEQRFILIDDAMQNLGRKYAHCFIYYDKYTRVMYMYVYGETMTPMLYETGEPMLFDEG